jgi:Family of unknown function (DUF6194)
VTSLPGVIAVTASEANGAPEISWGDSFRPGVFRLNVAVGREAFERIIGYPPAAHADQSARWDYTAMDRLLPHPSYATQAWVTILNPGEAIAAQARSLLIDAHQRAVRRLRRRV